MRLQNSALAATSADIPGQASPGRKRWQGYFAEARNCCINTPPSPCLILFILHSLFFIVALVSVDIVHSFGLFTPSLFLIFPIRIIISAIALSDALV